MKTLIVYATLHGVTGKISQKIKEGLGDDVVLLNLTKERIPSLKTFHRIIIGGSIHAGKVQRQVTEFCNRFLEELTEKEIGLFICCIEEGEVAERQFMGAFPEELRIAAKTTAIFKGYIDLGRMNYFDRFFIRRIVGTKPVCEKIDFEAVRLFAKRMDHIFNPFLYLR